MLILAVRVYQNCKITIWFVLFLNFRYNFNLTFFKRFWCVLLVLFPCLKSVSSLMFLLLICLVLLGMLKFILVFRYVPLFA